MTVEGARVDPREEPDAGSPVVVCEGVTHVYRRGRGRGLVGSRGDRPAVTALSDVSLSVEPGELTVVAGASGSGKSTLLHLLAALDTPTEGRVRIDGTDTADLTERGRTALRRSRIGIVFQRFHLLPSLTARSNVALPLVERGVGRARRRERAEALLAEVGMADRTTHRPGELSGGEQQRVAIARALVASPAIVIADEPTGELDTETGGRILSLLEDVAADRAVVVASHDPQVIEGADRVVRLQDGSVRRDE